MKTHEQRGFTLIEVLVVIVLLTITLAAILPFLDQVYLLSYEPGAQMRDNYALRSAMEELVLWHTNDLDLLMQHVGDEGGSYLGQFTVVDNHYITFTANQETDSVSSNNLLKITLENQLGETATRLFTVPL
jgi:prepilin-type N-terminal cleavage/methylation domain-containing protein